jgi:hypothetical protein
MADRETPRVRADLGYIETATGPGDHELAVIPIRRRRACAAALIGVVLTAGLVLAGCGTSSSISSRATAAKASHRTPVTPTSPAERATFLGHAGLAFGAFHRYVYVPFRSGSLHNPAHQRLAAAQAGAAITAATREIMLAKQAAVGSTALRKLYAPLAALEPTLRALATNLHRGRVSGAAIKSANIEIAGVEQIGSAAGVKIFERTPLKP